MTFPRGVHLFRTKSDIHNKADNSNGLEKNRPLSAFCLSRRRTDTGVVLSCLLFRTGQSIPISFNMVGVMNDVSTPFTIRPSVAYAPCSLLTAIDADVPTACAAVPIERPCAPAPFTCTMFIVLYPSMAPSMPTNITTAAVREGIPPTERVTSMAMGVVTDLGAHYLCYRYYGDYPDYTPCELRQEYRHEVFLYRFELHVERYAEGYYCGFEPKLDILPCFAVCFECYPRQLQERYHDCYRYQYWVKQCPSAFLVKAERKIIDYECKG